VLFNQYIPPCIPAFELGFSLGTQQRLNWRNVEFLKALPNTARPHDGRLVLCLLNSLGVATNAATIIWIERFPIWLGMWPKKWTPQQREALCRGDYRECLKHEDYHKLKKTYVIEDRKMSDFLTLFRDRSDSTSCFSPPRDLLRGSKIFLVYLCASPALSSMAL